MMRRWAAFLQSEAGRVGTLGFLAHPELTAEGGGASGNYGLMDIVAALKWVKGNIARFDGDLANVTRDGQWTGLRAIVLGVASSHANRPFHRAIGQSDGYALGGRPQTLADGEKVDVAAVKLDAWSSRPCAISAATRSQVAT